MFKTDGSIPEYRLTRDDFEKIRRLIYEQSGIVLPPEKIEPVRVRLGKRLRQGRFKSFRDYYQYVLRDDTGGELVYLLDSLSAQEARFFREPAHFDFLQKELIPRWRAAKNGWDQAIQIWSAGCSTGEEVYSIAISLLEGLGSLEKWKIHLLASDISIQEMKKAVNGIYEQERICPLPASTVKKYFLRGENTWRDHVKIKNSLKELVTFKRINLLEPFSFPGAFDCIFCRNVMIYFDKKNQQDLVNRFYRHLEPGGILILGQAESLTGMDHPYQYIQPGVYQR